MQKGCQLLKSSGGMVGLAETGIIPLHFSLRSLGMSCLIRNGSAESWLSVMDGQLVQPLRDARPNECLLLKV
jgi:hypothetical protein